MYNLFIYRIHIYLRISKSNEEKKEFAFAKMVGST